MMSNLGKEKKINLLGNDPCHKDAFEGHSHHNIAVQIARILKEDDKRHIIGIEGGWGSGKSNLIALINIELNGASVYETSYDYTKTAFPFFVYDAWGHQADYQRRAILEELTQDLTQNKKILENKKWEKKLEGLLAKRKKTTTKEVPRLGVGLVMSIILCLITPLLIYMINLVPEDRWIWRLLIALFPYLFGLVWVLWDRIRSIKSSGQAFSISALLSELILVYKDQIKENETYTSISEKEPSSAEFKAWMDEVNKDLKKQNKTLIIVFDNMDRLPSQKVESLWSSIHSFFSDKTYDSIKVLIPFDRLHVKCAFRNEDAEGESFGNDFINKTFDVVFRVPPPIMSGWQLYMDVMWKKAFGQDSPLHSSVTQIYNALCKHHTPRKIIAFINEVATIKMTMGEGIPDKYIALFIFGKESIEKDPVGQLLNPDFMGDVRFEYERDPDMVKFLSALYYQLPPDKALDVVFTREATEALNSGKAERLHEMMEHLDLPPILGNAVLKVTDVENATLSLARLDDYYGFSSFQELPSWLKQVWESLYQKCSALGVVWNEIRPFHVPLYTHLYKESLANDLVKGYLSVNDDLWDAKAFVDTIDALRLNSEVISKKLHQYKRAVSPKLFLELLKLTRDRYNEYGITYNLNELDLYLGGLSLIDILSIKEISYIDFDDGKQLSKYKEKLRDLINGVDQSGITLLPPLFDRLKEVSDRPLDFASFFNDSRIYSFWVEAGKDNTPFKYDLMAMRLARESHFNPSYSASFNEPFISFKESDVESLASVIEYYVDYGYLLTNSEYYKSFPIVKGVVKRLTSNDNSISRVAPISCLTHFDQTVSDYELNAEELFHNLSNWEIKPEDIDISRLPSGLIELAGKVNDNLSSIIHSACEKKFSSLTQDQWKAHCIKKDDIYRVWKIYHPKKYQANFDAFKAVMKDYANGTTSHQPDSALIKEWMMLCIEAKHSVKGLFNDISSILKRDSMINKAKLLFFGGYILEYTDAEKQNDFVLKLIPTEIIDSDVITFIYDYIERLKVCEVTDEFKEKIRHFAETNLMNDRRVETICQAWGIKVNNTGDSNHEEN